MSTSTLLGELRMRGVKLRSEGDRLLYHPTSAVSGELLDRLKAGKAELLAELELEQEEAIPILETRVLFRSRLGVEVLEVIPVCPAGQPRWEKRLGYGKRVTLVGEVTRERAVAEMWVRGLRAREDVGATRPT